MPIPAGQRSGRCKVCQSPQRFRVELLLVSGAGRRAIAKKFGLSPDSIWRHGRLHISADQRTQLLAGPVKLRELADRAAEENLSVLEYTAMVRSAVLRQFFAAGEADDRQSVALLTGRLTELLRLQAHLSGQLSSASSTVTNNMVVMGSPVMADVEQVLLERLRPYPDAAQSVFEGLEQLRAMRLGQPVRERAAIEHVEPQSADQAPADTDVAGVACAGAAGVPSAEVSA
jgi:hypothetical protein